MNLDALIVKSGYRGVFRDWGKGKKRETGKTREGINKIMPYFPDI